MAARINSPVDRVDSLLEVAAHIAGVELAKSIGSGDNMAREWHVILQGVLAARMLVLADQCESEPASQQAATPSQGDADGHAEPPAADAV